MPPFGTPGQSGYGNQDSQSQPYDYKSGFFLPAMMLGGLMFAPMGAARVASSVGRKVASAGANYGFNWQASGIANRFQSFVNLTAETVGLAMAWQDTRRGKEASALDGISASIAFTSLAHHAGARVAQREMAKYLMSYANRINVLNFALSTDAPQAVQLRHTLLDYSKEAERRFYHQVPPPMRLAFMTYPMLLTSAKKYPVRY